MKNTLFFLLILSFTPVMAAETQVFRIEVGQDYERYSPTDLKRRVWELERAVAQLQAQVFHLTMNNMPPMPQANPYTCRISVFGKTYDETRSTKTAALVAVVKKCSEATHAVHCHEEEVKCSNE